MKPPEQVRRELVVQWIGKAEDDWRLSHRLVADPEPYAEATAFHAQQAVEKYLKAFLTWYQVEFPKTHDIKRLLELAGERDQSLAKVLSEAAELTIYAVQYRYPDDSPPVTPADMSKAVETADLVRSQIRARLPADVLG